MSDVDIGKSESSEIGSGESKNAAGNGVDSCKCRSFPLAWVLVVVLGCFLIYSGFSDNGCENKSSEVVVYYLMPLDCVDCNPEMLEDISSKLEIYVKSVESDSVTRPSVFVVAGNKSTLGLANSELNILSLLCEFAKLEESCVLQDELLSVSSAVECLSKHNISDDAVFFYTQDECAPCSDMLPWIKQLKAEGFVFHVVDVDKGEDMSFADECLTQVLDIDGIIPQFACVSNGQNRLGAFTSIEDMRSFSENCKN